ncbi:hypothetical protein JCM13591A_06220 [Microbacterium xylanilyticum]
MLVTMGFSEVGRWVLASLIVIVPALIVGWFAARKGILAAAKQREGFTGKHPVLPHRQASEALRSDG